MPVDLPHDALDYALASVAFAQQVRKMHRRRTERRSPQRAQDIEDALARLRTAMKPLRSWRGAFPYGPQTTIAFERYERVADVSEQIQKERRKLHKMKARTG